MLQLLLSTDLYSYIFLRWLLPENAILLVMAIVRIFDEMPAAVSLVLSQWIVLNLVTLMRCLHDSLVLFVRKLQNYIYICNTSQEVIAYRNYSTRLEKVA